MKKIIALFITLCCCQFLSSQQEGLKTDDAITIGEHSMMTPDTGTIEFDGVNFRAYDGANWWILNHENQWNEMTGPYDGKNYVPRIPGSTLGIHDSSMSNPGAWLYINNGQDTSAAYPSSLVPYHIMMEDSVNKDVAVRMRRNDIGDFIFGVDTLNELVFNLGGTFEGRTPGVGYYDNVGSILGLAPSGVVSMPKQSRARSFQEIEQAISPLTWTPLEMTTIQYDAQGEMMPAPPGSVIYPGPPVHMETGWFMANQEGYYQINARCEFRLDTVYEPGILPYVPAGSPNAMVTIGIFKGFPPGVGISTLIAQGNSMAITDAAGVFFLEGAAPNVSDVVYLMAGEAVSIWVMHTNVASPLTVWPFTRAINAVPPGPHEPPVGAPNDVKCYMSVHKSS